MGLARVLVTGCARSGTGYTAALLTRLGLACGHERVYQPATTLDAGAPRDGAPRWPAALRAESSWLAAPFLGSLPEGTLVLHQVRHPLAVVRSNLRIEFFTTPSAYLDFAQAHLAGLDGGSPLQRAARYWVGWNGSIERAAATAGLRYRRCRLEDLDERLVREILAEAGHDVAPTQVRLALAETPPDTNTRGRRSEDGAVDLQALAPAELREELERMARRYGYADAAAALPLRRLPESLRLY